MTAIGSGSIEHPERVVDDLRRRAEGTRVRHRGRRPATEAEYMLALADLGLGFVLQSPSKPEE